MRGPVEGCFFSEIMEFVSGAIVIAESIWTYFTQTTLKQIKT